MVSWIVLINSTNFTNSTEYSNINLTTECMETNSNNKNWQNNMIVVVSAE